jgi:Low affinity iron permease
MSTRPRATARALHFSIRKSGADRTGNRHGQRRETHPISKAFGDFANIVARGGPTLRLHPRPWHYLHLGRLRAVFHYSDTWQLIINTGTTIVTFLMVFLIQNSQNRDNAAIQVKLDELIPLGRSRTCSSGSSAVASCSRTAKGLRMKQVFIPASRKLNTND